MLQPTKVQVKGIEVDAICVHWKDFPVPAAVVAKAEDTTIDDLFRKKSITPIEWQRAKFWQANCGKFKMNATCGQCPHVRTIEERSHLVVLVTPDGKTAVPVTDSLTMETLSKYRQFPPPSFKQGS